jgi:hypothetical protein
VRRDGRARGWAGGPPPSGLADSVATMTARMSWRATEAWDVLARTGLQVDGRCEGQPSGRPDGGIAFPSAPGWAVSRARMGLAMLGSHAK